MFTLGVTTLVLLGVGTAAAIAIGLRISRNASPASTVAQVLYDVEHPEQTR